MDDVQILMVHKVCTCAYVSCAVQIKYSVLLFFFRHELIFFIFIERVKYLHSY